MKKGLVIFWTMIKGLFVCQHYASNLFIDRLLERLPEDEDGTDFQHWNCECTCRQCGERGIEQKFALSAYNTDPTTRYPMKSEYADETYL